MKNFLTGSLLSVGLLIASILTASGAQLDRRFSIMPMPQQVEVKKGGGFKWSVLAFITATGDARVPVLGSMLDGLPRHGMGGKGVKLFLSDTGVPDSGEGYVLVCDRDGVRITARSQAGLFYGCQTLEQFMEDSKQFGIEIPAMEIVDYPSVAYRSVHIDNKHHLDRTEYYYTLIDKLARYKVNGIIWEVEDKLRYTRRPEVAAPNAISKQEMLAISNYAKERNIEISPLIQGLGHAGYILKHHWELCENKDSDWEFCPSEPRTYEMLFDLYKDAMEAMPYGKFLHVGGDEISQIGVDDRCIATGKTPFELQMYWLGKVCDFAVENGRRPVFWDDMPLKHGGIWYYLHFGVPDEQVLAEMTMDKVDEAIKLFPKDCVYMRWHYNDATILPNLIVLDWYQRNGLQVMAATAASDAAGPFVPRHNARAQYIKDFSRLTMEHDLVGIFATAWGDGSNHLETVTRGFIAQGEFGWNPNGRTVEQFKGAHAQREFGLTYDEILFLDDLEKAAFFFDFALAVDGRRNPAFQVKDFTLIDLPDRNSPGAWSEKYSYKLDSVHMENARYRNIENGFEHAQKNALRNRYTLDVYEHTSNLINYPVRLYLALEEYDKAKDDNGRQAALRKISDVCDYFEVMKKNLIEVYAKTRFMQNADGYIADLNHHHHLASLTNNSDWMFLYEIPMVEKVRKWMDENN